MPQGTGDPMAPRTAPQRKAPTPIWITSMAAPSPTCAKDTPSNRSPVSAMSIRPSRNQINRPDTRNLRAGAIHFLLMGGAGVKVGEFL